MNHQRTHQTQYSLKPSHQDQTRLAPLSPPFSFYPQSVDFLIAIFISSLSKVSFLFPNKLEKSSFVFQSLISVRCAKGHSFVSKS